MGRYSKVGLRLVLWLGGIAWVVGAPVPDRAVEVAGNRAGPVLTLTAAGDVIMHSPIVNSAYNPRDGGYDFRPIFSGIKADLTAADLAVAVLETPLNAPGKNFSGYPCFNAPGAIADALQWAGIDLVFTAHNHALDQGMAGIRGTISYLNRICLPQVGLKSNATEPDFKILEARGIKVAFFAYTTSTNGLSPPAGEEWALNLLNYQKLAVSVKEAKEMGAELTVLALHTGTEYQRTPSAEQAAIMTKLAELGIDIILGSHVHVIQPYELRRVTDSDQTRYCFTAYSLGNFLSNQQWRYSDCGLVVTLELQKNKDRPGFVFNKISHFPVWVERHPKNGKYGYLIKKVSDPDAATDPTVDREDRLRMAEVWRETEALLDSWGDRYQ